MKTIRMSVVLASMVGAATLLLAVPVSMSASPGSEWDDYFYSGFYSGEPITTRTSSYQSSASQEFDVFNSGDGEKVEDFQKAYMGTSLGSEASAGWDIFRAGEGDPLP